MHILECKHYEKIFDEANAQMKDIKKRLCNDIYDKIIDIAHLKKLVELERSISIEIKEKLKPLFLNNTFEFCLRIINCLS